MYQTSTVVRNDITLPHAATPGITHVASSRVSHTFDSTGAGTRSRCFLCKGTLVTAQLHHKIQATQFVAPWTTDMTAKGGRRPSRSMYGEWWSTVTLALKNSTIGDQQCVSHHQALINRHNLVTDRRHRLPLRIPRMQIFQRHPDNLLMLRWGR